MVCAEESVHLSLNLPLAVLVHWYLHSGLLNSKGNLLVALRGDCVQVCGALLSWRDLLV